jgi:hypothetical protein
MEQKSIQSAELVHVEYGVRVSRRQLKRRRPREEGHVSCRSSCSALRMGRTERERERGEATRSERDRIQKSWRTFFIRRDALL